MKSAYLFAAIATAAPALAAEPTFKPIIDARLRYENVDQTGIARNANALTARVRAGFDVLVLPQTRLLVEGEGTLAISDQYNSTTNGKTLFPSVADPENIEINRLQLQTKALASTVATFGRQRINLDDQRFVGSVGWRDNEQTFDAARVEYTPTKALKIDLTYAWRDRTIFGVDSAQESIHGDNILANVAYKTSYGTLTGFGYFIDQDLAIRRQFSSKTYGVRFVGKHPFNKTVSLSYALSYAHQTDGCTNLNTYAADYWLADASLAAGGFTGGAGYEVLGADTGAAFTSFQTPLATLHKFQGWADKFLTTPGNGIRDAYGSAGYVWKKAGPFDAITATAIYHDFRSDRLSQHYGNEIDASVAFKKGRYTVLVKYADYNAKTFATDTKKVWLALDYAL